MLHNSRFKVFHMPGSHWWMTKINVFWNSLKTNSRWSVNDWLEAQKVCSMIQFCFVQKYPSNFPSESVLDAHLLSQWKISQRHILQSTHPIIYIRQKNSIAFQMKFNVLGAFNMTAYCCSSYVVKTTSNHQLGHISSMQDGHMMLKHVWQQW